MSDHDKDTAVVEDRLRSALSSMASAIEVTPDRWEVIESRAEGRRRRRTFLWAVGGPAVALAAVALFVAVLPAGDKKPSVVAGPTAALWYAPQGAAASRYTLQAVETGGSGQLPAGASSVRVYGHRAADGVSLDEVLMVITAQSSSDAGDLRAMAPGSTNIRDCGAPSCFGLPTTKAMLRGRQMGVTKGDRASSVVWDEPGGPTVGVMERGMGEDEYYAAVDGVEIRDRHAAAGTLPSGFTEIHAGVWPALPRLLSPSVVIQRWARGATVFTVEVHQGAGVSLDTRAWLVSGTLGATVNGLPALYASAEGDQTSVIWSPRPGVVLVVSGAPGPSLHEFAQNVQPITEAQWAQLAVHVPGVTPPIATTMPPAGTATTIASGRVGDQDWTLTLHTSATGASGCFQVALALGMAGICDLDIAGPNTVGIPQYLGNLTTDGTLSFVLATVGSGVSAVRSEWSDGIAEWTDGPSARTGARIVDTKGALPYRLLIIPVANWSMSRPTSLTGLDADGNDLNWRDVAEPSPCWPVCNQSPPTTAG